MPLVELGTALLVVLGAPPVMLGAPPVMLGAVLPAEEDLVVEVVLGNLEVASMDILMLLLF